MTTPLSPPESASPDLLDLARCMAGDFSNQKQALENSKNYAHIHVLFRPLPFEFFSGIGFYSEQVYDYDLWNPYRQGIHRFVAQLDHIYIENYSLKDAFLYAGAARNLDILNTISPDQIQPRHHCAMVFRREGELWRGGVEPGNLCLIESNGCQTYLISDVEVTASTWVSLDRGMDLNTDEQIWGSRFGPLRFEKRESFAHEVPAIL
jgi:CpeT protein